jgi:hypothetical protein
MDVLAHLWNLDLKMVMVMMRHECERGRGKERTLRGEEDGGTLHRQHKETHLTLFAKTGRRK